MDTESCATTLLLSTPSECQYPEDGDRQSESETWRSFESSGYSENGATSDGRHHSRRTGRRRSETKSLRRQQVIYVRSSIATIRRLDARYREQFGTDLEHSSSSSPQLALLFRRVIEASKRLDELAFGATLDAEQLEPFLEDKAYLDELSFDLAAKLPSSSTSNNNNFNELKLPTFEAAAEREPTDPFVSPPDRRNDTSKFENCLWRDSFQQFRCEKQFWKRLKWLRSPPPHLDPNYPHTHFSNYHPYHYHSHSHNNHNHNNNINNISNKREELIKSLHLHNNRCSNSRNQNQQQQQQQ